MRKKFDKKIYTYSAILVIALVVLLVFGFSSPDKDAARASVNSKKVGSESFESLVPKESQKLLPVDNMQSIFEFEGFGPGKSHFGTFDSWQGNLLIEDNEIIGIEGTIQANSVNTGIEGLDSHLRNDDFFDVEKYPEIHFVSDSISNGEMIGILTFRGVAKELIFPVSVTKDSISADFILDITEFEFKYAGVNKEVRISFEAFI